LVQIRSYIQQKFVRNWWYQLNYDFFYTLKDDTVYFVRG
jgi:hypothetical protein